MKFTGLLFAAALAAVSASAHAGEFEATWSGSYYGNSASAVGYFDINSVPVGDTALSFPNTSLSVISLTVTGAGASSGTFGQSAFYEAYLWTPSALNLTNNLVGQTLSNGGTTWGLAGSEGQDGDFNLFSATGAPTGYSFFDLEAGSEQMTLTSLSPVEVPEPGAAALFGVGLLGLGLVRARKTA